MSRTMAIKPVFVKVGQYNIRYIEAGKGDKTIVLLHGLGASAERWLPVIPHLSTNYRVIVPDIIGFGHSDKPTIDYTVEFLSKFLFDFLNHLFIVKPTLIGSSLGGRILTEYAIQNPQNIEKIVLVSPAGFNEESTPALNSYIQAALHPKFEDVKKAFLMMAGNDKPIEQQIVYEFINHMKFTNAKMSFMSSLMGLRKSTLTPEHLSKILNPTLLIWGKDDSVIPITHAKKFVTLIKNCQYCKMEGCGHAPYVDAPELFSKIVLDFLD